VDIATPQRNELKSLTGQNVPGSVETYDIHNISHYWPVQPTPNLHIIVEFASGERCAHRVSEISLTLSRLSLTSFLTSLLLLAALLTMSLAFIATYHAF
jgi:hypothetical protein